MTGFIHTIKFFFVSPQYFFFCLLLRGDYLTGIEPFILFESFKQRIIIIAIKEKRIGGNQGDCAACEGIASIFIHVIKQFMYLFTIKPPPTLINPSLPAKTKKKISVLKAFRLLKSYFQKKFVIYQSTRRSLLEIVQKFAHAPPAIKQIYTTCQLLMLLGCSSQLPDRFYVESIVSSHVQISQFEVNSVTEVKQVLFFLFFRQKQIPFNFYRQNSKDAEIYLMQSIERRLAVRMVACCTEVLLFIEQHLFKQIFQGGFYEFKFIKVELTIVKTILCIFFQLLDKQLYPFCQLSSFLLDIFRLVAVPQNVDLYHPNNGVSQAIVLMLKIESLCYEISQLCYHHVSQFIDIKIKHEAFIFWICMVEIIQKLDEF